MNRFKTVLIDKSALDYPLTELLLDELPDIAHHVISTDEAVTRLRGIHPDASCLPKAKKTLLITRNTGSFLKSMATDPGITDRSRSESFRFEILQGCSMDCRYCFCQQYLSCHHSVVFSNPEDSLLELASSHPLRLVTGDISDSLVLGRLSIVIHDYLSALISDDSIIELRSKCILPDNWHLLKNNVFELDWSITVPDQWRLNEPGTASPLQRIESAATAAKAGFKVGIRFDPLQPERIDKKAYYLILKHLYEAMKPMKPRAFTVGSYKMSCELLEIIRHRFPHNPLPGVEWSRCSDGKIRPFKLTRVYSYRTIVNLIEEIFPTVPVYLSMEPSYVLNFFKS
jgi:hypothetical protein